MYLQFIIREGMIRVLSDGKIIVDHRREQALDPPSKLIKCLSPEHDQSHQIGRVVGGVESEQLLPHINIHLLWAGLQRLAVSWENVCREKADFYITKLLSFQNRSSNHFVAHRTCLYSYNIVALNQAFHGEK